MTSTDKTAAPLNDAPGDTFATRLDALELQAMDAELAQATLDAVVIRHGEEIDALQRAIAALVQRVDGLAPATAGDGDGGADTESLASALERERPPHY